jgi:UDP-N-acetyl-D-glucosamine dehydrogenase
MDLNDERKAMKGSNVLLLGVAYKKDVNDVRESPALSIIDRLACERRERALSRSVCRGVHFDDAHTDSSGEPLSSVPLTNDELQSADCVIIVTDHSDIDYKRVCSWRR